MSIVTAALRRLHTAADDAKDVISMDVPLFIRLLEQAHEDIKSDAELHELVERVLTASKEQDVLTMEQYEQIKGESNEARD